MFEFVEKEKIKLLSFIDNDKIVAAVTTRSSGASEGCYSSFNLGLNTKEPISNVLQNRTDFLKIFPDQFNLFSAKQTHSNIIIDLDNIQPEEAATMEADGLITSLKNTMISVTTADCGNIIITDKTNSVIGAFHAGWRGLENKILVKGIKLLKSKLTKLHLSSELIAYIGPMITEKNYEVGKEFSNFFDKKYLISRNNSLYLDTVNIVEDCLKDNGVKTVYNCNIDTFEDKENFYSYRRDGETGRTMAFVGLK